MSIIGNELEIKLYLANLPAMQTRLDGLGACLYQSRVHETNVRFDTPSRDLTQAHEVLRLRQDSVARLTYKGPSTNLGGARSRKEIEFTVGDFEAARDLLEALGFEISLVYEKRRSVYELDGVMVSLDELPYGDFAEIEGAHPESIRAVAAKLGINWEARIRQSYAELFERLKRKLGLACRDLTFDNFRGLAVSPDDLGVWPADAPDTPGA